MNFILGKDGSYRSQFYLILEFCDCDLRKILDVCEPDFSIIKLDVRRKEKKEKKILNNEKIQLTLEHTKCIMVQILKG